MRRHQPRQQLGGDRGNPDIEWYIGTQFHPEYSSTVLKPHPLFLSFVKAAIENSLSTKKQSKDK